MHIKIIAAGYSHLQCRILSRVSDDLSNDKKYFEKCKSGSFELDKRSVSGATLIELIVFIVVISVALTAMVGAFSFYISNSVDPVVQIRALECAQSKIDEITARKFDENTPSSNIPACGSAEVGAVACSGISADSDFDDVGDFSGQVDTTKTNCSLNVTVVNAGVDFGVSNDQVRRITVDATSPLGGRSTLTTYRANF